MNVAKLEGNNFYAMLKSMLVIERKEKSISVYAKLTQNKLKSLMFYNIRV